MEEKQSMKKEFSKKDVQRMRNIITGKTGDKTQILTGWEKKQADHKEGDVWEELGRSWTIKNGIKQTLTKLDGFKKLVVLPLCCPKCSKPMKASDLNKKMYSIYSACFNCAIDIEAKMKQEGTFQDYEKQMINSNKNASLEDFERAVDQWLLDKDTFVSEAGDVESWQGGDKTKMYQEIKANLDKLKNTDIY
jgi:hypothetical protein